MLGAAVATLTTAAVTARRRESDLTMANECGVGCDGEEGNQSCFYTVDWNASDVIVSHGRHSHMVMELTLFVSNLPYSATSTDLKTAFSDLAPVRSAFVVLEHGSGASKGVGYVSFAIKEDAQAAFESITANGMSINGRNLRVQWAESKVC